MQKEAKARLKINKLLEKIGWRLLDTPGGKANVQVETNVNLKDLGVPGYVKDYVSINTFM